MQKSIELSKIEISKRAEIKSRSFYSIIILCFITLFLITSWFLTTKWNEKIDLLVAKKVFSIIQIFLLTPFIVISYREILNFVKIKNSTLKSFLFSLITVIPFIFLIAKTFFINEKMEKKVINQYFAVFLISFIVLSLLSWKTYKKVFLFEFEILREKYSFLRLSWSAYLFWSALTFVGLVNGFITIFLLIASAILSDTLSFFMGGIFGKKKIFKFSPNKTWEGFIIGNYLALCILCFTIGVLKLNLKIYNFTIPTLFSVAMIAFILIFASVGDLFFSKQKRIFKLKNFSNLLGEHGGFWDRFDSHTFVLNVIFFINFVTILFLM